MSIVKKLVKGLPKKFVVFTALTPLVIIGEVSMEALIPLLMARIIDVGITSYNLSYVLKIGLLMIFASCFSLLCGVAGGRFTAVASQGFSRNLRKRLFNSVQKFSFPNIDKFSTGSLVTRLTTDVTNAQNLYQQLIRTFIRSPLMIISGIVLACSINFTLALIFILVVPFLAAFLAFIALKAYPRFKVMLKHYDKLNTIVQENLIGVRLVKSFVRGEFENKNFDKVAKDFQAAQVKAEKLVILNMPVMRFCVNCCVAAVLWKGGLMAVEGKIQVGQLVSIITYVIQVLTSLMMLSMIFVNFILSRASIDRISQVLDEEPLIKNPSDDGKDKSFKLVLDGNVEFLDVSFSYTADAALESNQKDNKSDNSSAKDSSFANVISNISLKIPSGQFTGLLGGTGSGKSTLIQLIPRLYDVTSGMVKVGGVDVKKYDTVTLRDAVGVVLQKNVLFSGTIKENLKWGNPDATDSELEEACKVADADGFVKSLANGYDTYLEQGGVNLSGGQRQRLCIARALLKHPKILILDDSTSAVDTATERRIRTALRQYLPDSTIIVIAQRIASVQSADCIYVIDDGKINGCGTHEKLLAENKLYQEVFESQQQGSGDADIQGEL